MMPRLFVKLLLLLSIFLVSSQLSGQEERYQLDCSSSSDAVVGKDRKAWNPDPAVASEAYKHNIDIPAMHPDGIECLTLTAIEIEINQFSEDNNIPGTPAGNPCYLGYFTHALACEDTGHFVCDVNSTVLWESGGPFNSFQAATTLTDNNLDNGFQLEDLEGEVLAFDFIIVVDAFDVDCNLCSISAGEYSSDHEICVTLVYEFDEPEDELNIPEEEEFCLDPNEPYEFDAPNDYEEYEWFDDQGNSVSVSPAEEFEVPFPGEFTLLVTDEQGCTQEADIEFLAVPEPTVTYSLQSPLINCSVSMDTIRTSVNSIEGNTNYNYSWETPTGNIIRNSELIPADTGAYVLTIEDRNFDCEFVLDPFIVRTVQNSSAQIDSVQIPQRFICLGSSITLSAFVPYQDTTFYNFAWVSSSDTTRSQTFSISDEGRYFLLMQDTFGCPATIDSVDIRIAPNLTAGEDNTQELCPSANTNLNDFVINASSNTGEWVELNSSTVVSNPNNLSTIGFQGLSEYLYIVSNVQPCINDTAIISLLFPTITSCDDNNLCTENDMGSSLSDGTVCVPCQGVPLDCNTGSTTTRPCDDGNLSTVNDMETVLDCDDSVCVPCTGEPADCNTGTPTMQACDDLNPCTINDMEAVLADGTVCVTCVGEALDCSSGTTTTRPCDDGNLSTVNDMETVLDCDDSVCVPCAGEPADCNTGTQIMQACDDLNPCTINDMEAVLADGTICVPCQGELLDCNTGTTTTRTCDDGDPNTVNDMETVLDCDDSVCVPCAGEPADCNTGTQTMQVCDDFNPCTENDMETVLPDGTVCVPCAGVALDCNTGTTTTRTCDDGDPNTVSDMETVLDCDDSVCVPCAGEPADCSTGTQTIQACDDLNPCTENDMETVLPDGTVCVPCAGVALDCNTGATTTRTCDDGDPNTVSDMETVLDCDNSVCVPCAGEPADCSTGNQTMQPCDDLNPCTENDMETVLPDGTVCALCEGTPLDCNSGMTTTRPCDDQDDNTINDIETILDCDDSICIPCAGEAVDCTSGTIIMEDCDDNNPCTENDTQSVLSNGTICIPCEGIPLDCNTGTTTTQTCDDSDPNTVDDIETILDCDGSICVPCAGVSADCSSGTISVEPCDDSNPCTENDMRSVLPDGTVCIPCEGTPLDCNTGITTTENCDDGDPNTINDMRIILDCDGSICVPCAGESADCISGEPQIISCDDGNLCTTNDTESILPDGTVCNSCQGELQDCDNGMRIELPCDDANENTFDDIVIVLECDGTVCVPCVGQLESMNLFLPNVMAKDEQGNDEFRIFSNREAQIIEFQIFDRWGNVMHSVSNVLSSDPAVTWRGDFEGEDAQQGVYIYRLEYLEEETVRVMFGDITIIR